MRHGPRCIDRRTGKTNQNQGRCAVKIYLMGEQAFVELPGSTYMLCIGSKTEVDAADEKRLIEMIKEAIVWSQYRSIGSAKGHARH